MRKLVKWIYDAFRLSRIKQDKKFNVNYSMTDQGYIKLEHKSLVRCDTTIQF